MTFEQVLVVITVVALVVWLLLCVAAGIAWVIATR